MLILSILACWSPSGPVQHEAIGGGQMRIRITGALQADLVYAGASQAELSALTDYSFDYPWPTGGRVMLVRHSDVNQPIAPDAPWSIESIGEGVPLAYSFPAKSSGWLGVDFNGDRVGSSIGLYESYEADSIWSFDASTPEMVVGPKGTITAKGQILKNGTEPVGDTTYELTWALDPTITHSWTTILQPRKVW